MSLYLKYRPQKFKDLVGQDTTKKILENAIKTGATSHGYLFVGPKGTGKTSSARLLSKALNCTNRKSLQSEPCNQCSSCKEISSGHSLDVLEIDAASNRGIDEIRDLRDKIRYAPSGSKYKIFIIDEVHMLTKESFNALLKTLEEPPKHAIFIMATTEPDKVPDTILSRVQEFQFNRALINDLVKRISQIVKIEKIKIENAAINLIAQKSDGSFRDALSILDQVNSVGEKNITLNIVEKTIGLVGAEKVGDFIEYLTDKKITLALELISSIHIKGFDLVEFNNQIIHYLRNLLIFSSKAKINLIVAEKELKRMKNIAEKIKISEILDILAIFIGISKEIKIIDSPELPLELAVYEVCEKKQESLKLNNNLELEKKISPGIIKNKLEVKKELIKENSVQESKKQVETIKSEDIDVYNPQEKWNEFIDKVGEANRSLSLLLKDSNFSGISNNEFKISVKFKFYAEKITENKNYSTLVEKIEQVFGKKCKINCLIDDAQIVDAAQIDSSKKNSKNDLVSQAMDVFDI